MVMLEAVMMVAAVMVVIVIMVVDNQEIRFDIEDPVEIERAPFQQNRLERDIALFRTIAALRKV